MFRKRCPHGTKAYHDGETERNRMNHLAMKQFHLYTGNRLERLIDRLAEILRTPLSTPLASELIIVQSRGMERWLSMELARRHGICANIRFPFPNSFVYDYLFRRVLPDLPDLSPFDRNVMTWRILRLLPDCLDAPEFAELKQYLGDGKPGLRHYQLASRIAHLYDQYIIFRPRMIFDWENGARKDGWQAALWRRLMQEVNTAHRAALSRDFLVELSMRPEALRGIPERISVFGISALPEFHISIFEAVARHREVNFFLMNPCAAYWGDLMSERERRRIVREARERGIEEEALYLGERNSFLVSMGLMGRDFFDMIQEYQPTGEEELFEEPEGNTILSWLQSDILHRRERPSEENSPVVIDPSDDSIRIHACHSPMREIEVLHDHLLALIANDKALRPRDILVMTPDIETYAPYIQAVFDRPSDDSRRIPFSIADRGARTESRIIDTFLGILDLTGGRFGAARVLAVLETAAVARRFGLSENDLDRISRWVRETRIRWGVDEKSRAELDLPAIRENTWKAGLDRLMLGYAMTGADERMFGEILPYDDIEGSEAAVMGQFYEFMHRLFGQVQDLTRPRPLREWTDTLNGMLRDFFQPSEDIEMEFQLIRDVLNSLADLQNRSGFETAVEIPVIRSWLVSRLNEDPHGFGFITGGVTFCAMLPMRSIPFQVLCLIGLDSDAYPRLSRPVGFDLMARHPKRGDRSRRNDDRYLFLESLLSARKQFYISYVGQSIRDNTPIPPSVLVSELMDAIRQGFVLPGKDILDDHVVTRHRLQAFNPAYFHIAEGNPSEAGDADRLFSYSDEYCETARRMGASRHTPPGPFITGQLSEPDEEWRTVDLKTLCRFFDHPVRFLLNQRLGVYLEEPESALEEKEAFLLEGLDAYRLRQDLAEKRLGGHDPALLYPVRKTAGELPHGVVGKYLYDRISREVDRFVETLQPYLAAPLPEPVDVSLSLGDFLLKGRIEGLYREGMIRYRCAAVKPKDLLRAWIYHLAYHCIEGNQARTIIAGTDAMWQYPPVPNPAEHLNRLLAFYWQGLRKPLRFFPASSWTYAEEVAGKNKPEAAGLAKARQTWEGGQYRRGEMSDPYYRRCFGAATPLDAAFQRLAREILGPVLACRKPVPPTP